ncbi:MAG: hypothetical protein Kow0037_30860 [Calditrichia bacterium]
MKAIEGAKSVTLISVIGKPYKGQYDPARYLLDGEIAESEFFFLPLLKKYRPDRFILLGTVDSIWERVEEVRSVDPFEYERHLIPFGVSEPEIWEIFKKIVDLNLKNTRVLIDITHGFRAVPFAAFLAAVYFQSVKTDVVIQDILYGNYEARDRETNVAPVVHLGAYLDMLEWIRAATRFTRYGDGDLLVQKLREYFTGKKEAPEEFLKEFQTFTDNLQFTFVSQVPKTASLTLSQLNSQTKKSLFSVGPYQVLHPEIMNQLKFFNAEAEEWERQWRVAEWFYDNRQYTRSLIVLRECLVTFTCGLLGISDGKLQNREMKASYLHNYLICADEPERLEKWGLSGGQIESIRSQVRLLRETVGNEVFEKWTGLLKTVHEARNRVGHALIKGKGRDEFVDPAEQIRLLRTWIREVKEIFDDLSEKNESGGKRLSQILQKIMEATTQAPGRLFLIVNEGVHPIEADLKRQYGENIAVEVVTRGNVTLREEKEVAERVRRILAKHPGKEVAIVPSGLPYLTTTVYNTVFQISSRHPVYLQLNRESGRYEEKNLNPRQLLL